MGEEEGDLISEEVLYLEEVEVGLQVQKLEFYLEVVVEEHHFSLEQDLVACCLVEEVVPADFLYLVVKAAVLVLWVYQC